MSAELEEEWGKGGRRGEVEERVGEELGDILRGFREKGFWDRRGAGKVEEEEEELRF